MLNPVRRRLGSLSDGVEGEDGEEWWEKVGVWNQVFRVRCGGRTAETQEGTGLGEMLGPECRLRGLLPPFLLDPLEFLSPHRDFMPLGVFMPPWGFHASLPPPPVIKTPLPPHLPLDMTPYPPTHPVEPSDSSSDSEADSIYVTVEKPGSLARLAAHSADRLVISQSVGRSFSQLHYVHLFL